MDGNTLEGKEYMIVRRISSQTKQEYALSFSYKGWLAIAKLKPLSLFISLLLMLKKALDDGKMVK